MKPALLFAVVGGLLCSASALAADAPARPLNWHAIGMFMVVVLVTQSGRAHG